MDLDNKDYGLFLSALAARYADINTTKRSIQEGGKERNPLLGEKPSNSDLNRAGIIASASTVGLALAMPEKYRKPFLGAITGMELALAHQNSKGRKYNGFARVMKKPLLIGALSGLLTHLATKEGSGISIEADPKGIALGYQRKF